MPQQPTVATHSVGSMLVTSLADGFLHEGTEVLRGIDGDEAARLLGATSQPFRMTLTVNAFLIRNGGRLTLIDAGCGNGMGADAGRLADGLQAAGVAPNEIGLVLLTHMHPDHIGGLLGPDGTARFPRARVLVPSADAAVFLSEQIAATVPDQVKPVFAGARAVATAYAGRFETFDAGQPVEPGITPVPLPGHSPGHTGYRIADGGQALLIWGDVVHVPELQCARPEVGMVFDADFDLAQRTRRDAFAAAAASGEAVAGMHMPFPGFAHVAEAGQGYALHPIASDSGTPA